MQRSQIPHTGEMGDIFALLTTDAPSPIGIAAAHETLLAHYGLDCELRLLTGERDENYWLRTPDGREWIFKVFGAAEEIGEAELLAAILTHLEQSAPSLPVPRPRANQNGDTATIFQNGSAGLRQCLMYSFLPGRPLFEVPRGTEQQRQCGALLAQTALSLKSFTHPRMHRPLIWDLKHLSKLRMLVPHIADLAFAEFVTEFLDAFASNVEPRLAQLPHQFVHNDFNARNLIVSPDDNTLITGIIDFGDAVFTARVADVAVGVIGQLSTADTAIAAMNMFVTAYHETSRLEDSEIALLPLMVAGRIVQNLVLTSWYRERAPGGEHFAAFGHDFFAWRIDLAHELRALPLHL